MAFYEGIGPEDAADDGGTAAAEAAANGDVVGLENVEARRPFTQPPKSTIRSLVDEIGFIDGNGVSAFTLDGDAELWAICFGENGFVM